MANLFEHIRNGDVTATLKYSDHITISPYLPLLCKILQVIQGPDRIQIIRVLQRSHLSSLICDLLNKDFTEVLSDAHKEQKLRQKALSRREDSALLRDTASSIDSVFAGSNTDAKLRVIASEIMFLQHKYTQTGISSELLACLEYRDIISVVLCVLCYKIPDIFDVREIIVMLLHLPESKCYINCLVINNPERYEEILHHLVKLFVESKAAFEKKVLTHVRDIAGLISHSKHLLYLDNISNTRKRIMLYKVLDQPEFEANLDITLSALFSQKDTTQLVDFVKNESKVFEMLVRFSDLRDRILRMVVVLRCEGEADVTMDRTKDEDNFYCSFLDETIQEDLKKATSGEEPTSATLRELTRSQVIRANQLLILYLNMINTCRISLLSNECKEIVELMLHKPCPGEEGGLFIRLSLAIFMSSTSLHCNTEVNDMLRKWLTQILNYSYEREGKGELLLLTGMHLHSGTYEMIGPLLSQSTRLNIIVSTGHAATIQTLWSQIQSEQQIVTQLANVPVTPSLSSSVTGYLSIHCMSQLINSRSPSCPPNLFSWLPRQLEQTVEPVHPVLCELIAGSVTYIMSPRGRGNCTAGITEHKLLALLSPSNSMSCRVLSFYYLLLYRNALSELKQKSDIQCGPAPVPSEYTVSLLGDDSAKTLLLHTRANRESYLCIYPTFLKLLVSQFPFLCDPQDLLAEEEANEHVSKLFKNDDNFNITQYLNKLLNSLQSGQESKCYYMISKMLKRHHHDIPSDIIAACIPHVAQHGFRVQSSFIKLWEMSAALNPQQTWLHSAQILVNRKITERELWVNPLLLFQSPTEIVKTTAGIRILLHMVKGYVSLCNARLADVDAPNKKKSKDHEESKILYLTLQNSAIVQILLDICSEGCDEYKNSDCQAIDAHTQYEHNALVYNFLHDFFIKNDGLSKLVCWQTFKFSEIEGVVNGVPSLHVACKFTTPLFQQASLQKQLFSLCLLSHLATQYPIQQTLAACNEMLQWAMTQTGELSTIWTVLSLSSFVRIAKVFPPLVDPITRLLIQQKKTLSTLNAESLRRKIKMYSETDDNIDPQNAIDSTFQELMGNILTRMKGT